MNPKQVMSAIKQQTKLHLTGDISQSVDFVYHNFEEHHAKASVWLHQEKGMDLNAYNIHDLIVNYDTLKMLTTASEDIAISDFTETKSKDFNPALLSEYFLNIKP